MKRLIMSAAIAAAGMASAQGGNILYKTVEANGCTVFYREAGDAVKPTILLLHGFPGASHTFRELMADLAGDYHLVAPDMPGFGETVYPDCFPHIFDALAPEKARFYGRGQVAAMAQASPHSTSSRFSPVDLSLICRLNLLNDA